MRTPPLAVLTLCPLLLLASSPASAQPAPAAPVARKAGAPPPPAAPPPAGAQKPDEPPPMPKVDVDDPALVPAAPAPHTLSGWKEALTMLNARSVDLLIAQQEVLRAQGSYQQAFSAALPNITGSASVSQNLLRTTTDIPKHFDVTSFDGKTVTILPVDASSVTVPKGVNFTTQITASQPIFALQTWYGIRTADLNARAAKLSVDDKRRLILAQAADAIISVFTAERIAEINRISLRNALQHQNLAERKSRLGDGTRLDVLRAQQDASTTRGTLIAGDESLRKAREVLGLSLGATEGYGVPPNISLNDMAAAINSTCAAGTLEQRADILAAKTSLEAATRGVQSARLAYLPTASVSSTLSASSDTLQSGKNVAWSIQGVVTIPIWDGNFKAGAVKIARATEEEAKLRLEGARRSGTLEILQAIRSVTVAEQARQVSEQNRDLAREAARLSERAFAAGAATSFDLIDASRQERSAEIDLAVKEFNLIQAKITAMLAAANCAY